MPRKKKRSPTPEALTEQDLLHIRELWLKGISVAELAEKFEQTREFMWGVLEELRPVPRSASDSVEGEAGRRIMECSFCGATQHERSLLIAGPRSLICEQCVSLTLQIIMEERPGLVRIEIGATSAEPSATEDEPPAQPN